MNIKIKRMVLNRSLASVPAEVEAELNTIESLKVVNARREKIARLKASLVDRTKSVDKADQKVLEEIRKSFIRHRAGWISTTQSQTISGGRSANLQILGINVGVWSLGHKDKDTAWSFHPDINKFPNYRGRSWEWSRDLLKGHEMRDFLYSCKNHEKAKSTNEREIQWQFADALLSPDKSENKALGRLRPVVWNGCFAELGVCVTAKGTVGNGTIDLMVRSGKGFPRSFLIFELKKPGVRDVKKALRQALSYATALNIEANKGEEPENLSNYHYVFGSKGKGALHIGAVVVIEDNPQVRQEALEYLNQYKKDCTSSDPVGVLLYPNDGGKTSWQWLTGWDAREHNRVRSK